MVFSSVIFLLFFLPIVVGVYLLLFVPVNLGFAGRFWRRAANLFLLLVSLVFYFWGEQFLVWIVLTSTFIDFVCGLLISGAWRRGRIRQLEPGGPRTRLQKSGLALSICSNLAFLGVFKYFNFGVDSFNGLIETLGLPYLRLDGMPRITLPLGISFYTFQSMSYTIDVYRGQVKASRSLIDFACYVAMFPQLVAGPIIRYRDIAGQLTGRSITSGLFSSGVGRFIIGLGKKVLIADVVAIPAEKIFALEPARLSCGVAWLGAVAYSLQIYFDFSGYSDMAIGLGRMLGFDYKENFNYPYISRSVREFWRRWHISLSSWFRDYLYISLGGNRRSPARTYSNLLVVFFLCGLWHGASWTFVVWGMYFGLFLVLERLWLGNVLERSRFWPHVYCMLVVVCGWVIFNTPTLSAAGGYFAAMAGFGTAEVESVSSYCPRDVRIALAAGLIFAGPVYGRLLSAAERIAGAAASPGEALARVCLNVFRVASLAAVLLVCLMLLSAGTHNPFIYFRF
jgi:alginate O-acetyltransferase complex protein AlgI